MGVVSHPWKMLPMKHTEQSGSKSSHVTSPKQATLIINLGTIVSDTQSVVKINELAH